MDLANDIEIAVSEARMNSVSHWGIPRGFKKKIILSMSFTLLDICKKSDKC